LDEIETMQLTLSYTRLDYKKLVVQQIDAMHAFAEVKHDLKLMLCSLHATWQGIILVCT